MTERKSLKAQLQKVLREIAIIVVGVLIALAVDAIVAARSDRRMERSYLQRLAGDLVADSAEYERQIEIERMHGDQARLLFHAMEGEPVDRREALRAIEEVGWFSALQLSPFTFRDLEATGNLRLIRSPAVRESLARYYYQAIDNRDAIYEFASTRAWSYAQYTSDVLPPDVRVQIGTGEPVDTALASAALRRLAQLPLVRGYISEVLVSTLSLVRIYRYWQQLAIEALDEVRDELNR